MKKFSFHLYHVSFLDSLFKGLKTSGASIDNVISKCQIKRFDLNSPSTYLPIKVCYEFMETVKYQFGIDHIASSFYVKFKLGDLSDYGQYLTRCVDLLSVLQNGIKYDHQIQTNGVLNLEIKGAVSRLSMVHKDPPSQARTISEKINMAMMLEAFQFVIGPNWGPLALELSTPDGQWALDLLPSTHVNIYTNSSHMAVVFRTKELATKNPSHLKNASLAEKELSSASIALNQVLNSMNERYIPTIEDISTFFGCSRRTILRQISDGGMSFHGMLQKHLFIRSLNLLKNQHNSVEDIATILGYANTSNFIRAFKKWTASTPDQYRKQAILSYS